MDEIREKAASDLGLDTAVNAKEREYDLTTSLLSAANWREDEDLCREAEIRRNGKFLFSVRLHPIGSEESRRARKNATTYMRNPQGPKYPQIEKDYNDSLYASWLIYLATFEEDQTKIWGNKSVMDKFGLGQNVETIDVLLRVGEKNNLLEIVSEISGFIDDTDGNDAKEETAKN